MKKKTKKILIGGLVTLFLIGVACAGTFYYYIFYPQFHPPKTTYIYIDKDDTIDSIYNKVKIQGHPKSFTGFLWMTRWRNYDSTIHTGRYPSAREKMCIMSSAVYTEDIRNLSILLSATYAL